MQSIIAAPVRSRSAFTSAAGRSSVAPLRSPGRLRRPRRSAGALRGRLGRASPACGRRPPAQPRPVLRPAASPPPRPPACLLLGFALLALLLLLAAPLLSSASRFSSWPRASAVAALDASPICDHQLARADRVVVAWDHEVDRRRVAVRVDEPDDRDPQAPASRTAISSVFRSMMKTASGSRFMPRTPPRLYSSFSSSDSHRHPLLGGQQVELSVVAPVAELVQAVDPRGDRVEVGQQATQPALVDVRHAAALGPFLDRVAGLLLGADEQDRPAAAGEVGGEPRASPSRCSVCSRSMMWIPSRSPKM